MSQNIVYISLKYIVKDIIGDILYWPLWWYSKGLVKTGFFCLQLIKNQEEKLGVFIWIKNIFVPMFGQYDLEGRIISFFARIFQILFRLLVLIIWILLIILLFIAWIIWPLGVIYGFYVNTLWLLN